MSPAEHRYAALWALTHLLGIIAALIVFTGLVRKTKSLVFLGGVAFLAVCTFAWAWPMDFLWFA